MRKLISSMLVMLSIIFLLIGCGNKDNAADASDRITVLLDEQPSDGDALIEALDNWSEETGYSYETLVIPYDDQLTKFTSMARNNDLPDIAVTTRLTRLYPEEFTDLKEYLDTSIFDQDILKVVGQNYDLDEVYLLPNQYTVTTYYYNKNAFEAAGIEIPTEDNPWTLDELYENAAKLQESGGVQYGLAVDFSRARYDNFMYSNGGSIVEKSGDPYQVTVNSAENRKTLQTFIDHNDVGILPRVIWTGGSNDNPADYFANGDVGIYLSGSWQYSTFSEDITSFEFGVMPAPKGTSGQSTILGGSGLAVPASAPNAALAIHFLKWLYEDTDNYLQYLETDNGLPFLEGVDVSYEASDDFEVMAAGVGYVTDTLMVDEESGWRNFLDNEYRTLLSRAVNGEITVEEALNTFAEQLAEKSDWKIK